MKLGKFLGSFYLVFTLRTLHVCSKCAAIRIRHRILELVELAAHDNEVRARHEVELAACTAASQCKLGSSDPAEEGSSASAMARPADAHPTAGNLRAHIATTYVHVYK